MHTFYVKHTVLILKNIKEETDEKFEKIYRIRNPNIVNK